MYYYLLHNVPNKTSRASSSPSKRSALRWRRRGFHTPSETHVQSTAVSVTRMGCSHIYSIRCSNPGWMSSRKLCNIFLRRSSGHSSVFSPGGVRSVYRKSSSAGLSDCCESSPTVCEVSATLDLVGWSSTNCSSHACKRVAMRFSKRLIIWQCDWCQHECCVCVMTGQGRLVKVLIKPCWEPRLHMEPRLRHRRS